MFARHARARIEQALADEPAVALIGPRQVGKTTLAQDIGAGRDALYLDLEDRADLAKLAEPRLFLEGQADRLVILDEIHRKPDLFADLRGIIDRGRRAGRRTGRFLLLGSASLELLRQAGETLAGRLAIVAMGPLDVREVADDRASRELLWLRGGFPDSFTARDDAQSLRRRRDFIRTYLERDVALFGPRVPAETLRRLWTMLAHGQGGVLNASRLAMALGVSATTVQRYIDLLVDLLLVRRLPPWHGNVGKRLVKAPKLYVRDSGLVHALLDIGTADDLAGHPVAGASWEGFVIETLIAAAPEGTQASFYRTQAGAELDLVLDLPDGKTWAVEIKRSLAPTLSRGFHEARKTVQPDSTFVVYAGEEGYRLDDDLVVIALNAAVAELQES
jgi:predicted AAA+ superfamily ATPase